MPAGAVAYPPLSAGLPAAFWEVRYTGDRVADGGNVIYFHIHAVFSVAVLNKDQVQIHGQECLDLKMSTVVISRRVKVLETVQAVFHGMIADMVLIQVVADGIGIAVDINVLVSPKIYRHIRSLESGVLLRKADPVLQIPQKASGVLRYFSSSGKKSSRFSSNSSTSSNSPVLSTRDFRFSKLLDILDSTKVAAPAFFSRICLRPYFSSFKKVTYT